jgi:hypothetical protein
VQGVARGDRLEVRGDASARGAAERRGREARCRTEEAVVPEGNTPSPSKLLDVNMLVMELSVRHVIDDPRVIVRHEEPPRSFAAHSSRPRRPRRS